MINLDEIDIELLMRLQYEFPLTPTPFTEVAEVMDIDSRDILLRLKRLNSVGVIKRVGFYLNFRAVGFVSALVAFNSRGNFEELAYIMRSDPLVSHNFLRTHPLYDTWSVIKASSREELLQKVKSIANRANIEKYIVLFSKRTLKLSVKYDLENNISRAGPWSLLAEHPPRPEDIGIPPGLPRELRILPLEERPYAKIAGKYGFSEEEIISLVKEMLAKGILGDPGAALNGHKIGFVVNGMVVVADDNIDTLCEKIATSVPEATHVVLREPYPPNSWEHNCYFMVHARRRDILEDRVKDRLLAIGAENYMIIYSIKDLKPGFIR